jgi:molybdenum cofactor guanylyltransferase
VIDHEYPRENISAVILAGGQGSRMGGQDKGLLAYRGRPLIEHVIDVIAPQVGAMVISANRHPEQYARYGYPVVADCAGQGEYWGPLAGILSALRQVRTEYLLTVPCDTPALPADLVSRLWRAMQQHNAEISVVHDGEFMQPVIALWRCTLSPALQAALEQGMRKTRDWISSRQLVEVDFSSQASTFLNVNTPDDLA